MSLKRFSGAQKKRGKIQRLSDFELSFDQIEERSLLEGSSSEGLWEETLLDIDKYCAECKALGLTDVCEPECWVVEARNIPEDSEEE